MYAPQREGIEYDLAANIAALRDLPERALSRPVGNIVRSAHARDFTMTEQIFNVFYGATNHPASWTHAEAQEVVVQLSCEQRRLRHWLDDMEKQHGMG